MRQRQAQEEAAAQQQARAAQAASRSNRKRTAPPRSEGTDGPAQRARVVSASHFDRSTQRRVSAAKAGVDAVRAGAIVIKPDSDMLGTLTGNRQAQGQGGVKKEKWEVSWGGIASNTWIAHEWLVLVVPL